MDKEAFITARLDKLLRQILHDHVGDPVTQQLLDQMELEVYTKCGWAVPITLTIDEDGDDDPAVYITWLTPSGNRHHIRFQELL